MLFSNMTPSGVLNPQLGPSYPISRSSTPLTQASLPDRASRLLGAMNVISGREQNNMDALLTQGWLQAPGLAVSSKTTAQLQAHLKKINAKVHLIVQRHVLSLEHTALKNDPSNLTLQRELIEKMLEVVTQNEEPSRSRELNAASNKLRESLRNITRLENIQKGLAAGSLQFSPENQQEQTDQIAALQADLQSNPLYTQFAEAAVQKAEKKFNDLQTRVAALKNVNPMSASDANKKELAEAEKELSQVALELTDLKRSLDVPPFLDDVAALDEAILGTLKFLGENEAALLLAANKTEASELKKFAQRLTSLHEDLAAAYGKDRPTISRKITSEYTRALDRSHFNPNNISQVLGQSCRVYCKENGKEVDKTDFCKGGAPEFVLNVRNVIEVLNEMVVSGKIKLEYNGDRIDIKASTGGQKYIDEALSLLGKENKRLYEELQKEKIAALNAVQPQVEMNSVVDPTASSAARVINPEITHNPMDDELTNDNLDGVSNEGGVSAADANSDEDSVAEEAEPEDAANPNAANPDAVDDENEHEHEDGDEDEPLLGRSPRPGPSGS